MSEKPLARKPRKKRTGITHTGKIARLPFAIREGVNQRLLDGQTAKEILQWLLSKPEIVERIKQLFGAEASINEENLSNWRSGGYQEWLKARERRKLDVAELIRRN